MKLTREKIETFAHDVEKWASGNHLGHDYSVFYNDKKLNPVAIYCEHKNGHYTYSAKVEENVNPLDYCEYFSSDFIAAMSYDGDVWRCLNGYGMYDAYDKLEELAKSYGLYIQLADSCHCEFCWAGESMDDVEYTALHKTKPVYLARNGFDSAPDEKILDIMKAWWTLSENEGDVGGCVIGEYMEFTYRGRKYRMAAQSPWQGEGSWTPFVETVKTMLKIAGATDIRWNCGRLD